MEARRMEKSSAREAEVLARIVRRQEEARRSATAQKSLHHGDGESDTGVDGHQTHRRHGGTRGSSIDKVGDERSVVSSLVAQAMSLQSRKHK